MKSPFWSLTRVSIKANSVFTLLRLKWKTNRREAIWIAAAAVIIPIGVIPMYVLMFILITRIYAILQFMGFGNALPLLFILMAQFLVLIFGIYYTLSVFYFSRDVTWLVSLPVTPRQLIMAKYVTILVNEYLSLLFFLPFLVHYGVISRGGIGYWLRLPLVFLLLPIIPLAIASLANVLLIRLVNVGRRKDLFIVLGFLLLIGFMLVGQTFLQRTEMMSEQQIASFFSNPNSLLQVIGRRFPPAIWATQALTGGGSSLLFLGSSLLMVLLLVGVGQKLYFRGLLGLGEVSTSVGVPGKEKKGAFAYASPLWAIFRREWRMMNRTPIFLLNGILTTILLPVMFVLMFSLNRQQDEFFTRLMAVQKPELKTLVAAAILLFCSSLNGTAASAVSREGSSFWISRLIPVRYRVQVAAKLLHALVISLLGMATGSLFVIFFLKVPLSQLVVSWVLTLLGSMAFASMALTIDLFHPLLDWISPQRAIKQNMNVFASMILDMVILFGLGFLGYKLFSIGVSPLVVFLVMGAVLALLGVLFIAILMTSARQNYSRQER